MKKLFFTLVFITFSMNVLSQCFYAFWACGSCTKNYEVGTFPNPQMYTQIMSAANAWSFYTDCLNLQNGEGNHGAVYWSDLGYASCVSGDYGSCTATINNSGKIVYATIRINSNSSIDWFLSGDIGPDQVDFESTVVHEFGHLFGLEHNSYEYSTMGPLPCGTIKVNVTSDIQDCVNDYICDIGGNDVEDYIFIFDNYPTYPNIYYINEIIYGRLESNFVDNFPYDDYIEDWGTWQVVALSTCGEVLVYESSGSNGSWSSAYINIPPLPTGYNWLRSSGCVIAKVRTSGTDNSGYIHEAEFDTYIGGVPNNTPFVKGCIAVADIIDVSIYPNPFNPSTTIKYQIPEDGVVTLKVYDVLGNEIVTLVNGEKLAGSYEVNFDGSDLASGVYIYRIQVNDFVSSKKMLLLK